jgi:hypothetical protein
MNRRWEHSMRLIRNLSSGGFGRVDEVELVDGTRVARKTFAPKPDLVA